MQIKGGAAVCTWFFVLMSRYSANGNGTMESRAFPDTFFSDLIITENLLFVRNVSSKLRCASMCYQTQDCMTFTHTRMTSGLRLCRGHVGQMTSMSNVTAASQGSEVYTFRDEPGRIERKKLIDAAQPNFVRATPKKCWAPLNDESSNRASWGSEKHSSSVVSYSIWDVSHTKGLTNSDQNQVPEYWMDAPCTGNQGCTQPNSRCFRDKCTCTQGYFYSLSNRTCAATCRPEDLTDSYLHYPGSLLWGYNVRQQTRSPQAVQQACSSDPLCLTYEWNSGTSLTNLGYVTPLTEGPADWDEAEPNWNYYQRKCA